MPEAVLEHPAPTAHGRDPALTVRWLTILGMMMATAMLVIGAVMLFDAREDTWQRSKQATENLALTLERDIERDLADDDAALRRAADALRLPGIDVASAELRQGAVFGRTDANDYLKSVQVVDAAGNIVLDSAAAEPTRLNLADRDFFHVLRARPEAGLYLSPPGRGRFRGGDPTIMISRRIPGPDGRFAGVVVGGLRLAYFEDLFRKLNTGAAVTVSLLGDDGAVIARQGGGDDANADLLDMETVRVIGAATAGSFVHASALDRVRRLETFRRVGTLPLLLVIALPVDGIFANWEHKAMTIGLTMVALCGATGLICLLFRREVLRRAIAESKLVEAAATMEELATTDALTGIPNRRAFDTALQREWRRAIRGKQPIGVLMIDVDCFKLFNDHYGHQEGDWALRGVAHCIQNSVKRPCDLAARYGGEEFIVLLQETDSEGAMVIAERIREAVAGLAIVHDANPTGRLTVSIGASVAYPGPAEAESALLKAADAALYDAKRAGRNRVGIAGRSIDAVAA